MTDLERRVGIFAALADQTRLRIVDLLTMGDLSSSEIAAALDLRSNLVAHHLRTLEAAEIIARTRSEFDRRRSYVGLRPEIFETLAPASVSAPDRVLFVCTANSARSQLAEVIWRDASAVPAASAGTLPAGAINPGAAASASRHGLDLDTSRRPRHIDDVKADGDLIITVCDDAHERLRDGDDLHWSIADPAVEGTAAAFDAAFEALRERIRVFSSRLSAA
ncbi:ArsR family transcriptional regulator [Microbacterium sp. SLBN-146]|uniref:arsenate reductase/protein-tyrosine-phosphatase family protein n=1 Tax=Microbacterium sp. SLBN-146 TaxID=2768457 RepID=UPI00116C3391|nr:ArsR family transcriptional regulator [Microbacterium sp. SLBN-146]TQJ31332.1 ArsR family transcriptional regulator [Microbacterium sp. SLBN-146]